MPLFFIVPSWICWNLLTFHLVLLQHFLLLPICHHIIDENDTKYNYHWMKFEIFSPLGRTVGWKIYSFPFSQKNQWEEMNSSALFFFLDSSSRRYLVNKQTICHRLLRVNFTLRQRIVYMRALEFLTDMDYGGTSLNLEAEDPVYKYKPTSYFCKCLFSAFLFCFVFWRCSVHWSKNYWGPHWG